jgi:hypothetical protein
LQSNIQVLKLVVALAVGAVANAIDKAKGKFLVGTAPADRTDSLLSGTADTVGIP